MLLKLIYKKREAENVYSFIFRPEKKIIWLAGQYLFYTFPTDNPDNRGVTRYFTISSAPFEKDIVITTRINKPSSTFKKSLVNMKIGEIIEASDPDGDFTIDDPPASQARALRAGPKKNYVFITGGIGITPFRSILLDLNNKNLPINAQLLYANRDKDIVFKAELESLTEKNKNFKISYFISPNHINNETMKQFSNLDIFYISGPEPFVESIEKILKALGAKPLNIKLDQFPGYES